MYNCMGQKSGTFSVELLSYYYLNANWIIIFYYWDYKVCIAVCVRLRMLNNLKSVLHHSQKRSVL